MLPPPNSPNKLPENPSTFKYTVVFAGIELPVVVTLNFTCSQDIIPPRFATAKVCSFAKSVVVRLANSALVGLVTDHSPTRLEPDALCDSLSAYVLVCPLTLPIPITIRNTVTSAGIKRAYGVFILCTLSDKLVSCYASLYNFLDKILHSL